MSSDHHNSAGTASSQEAQLHTASEAMDLNNKLMQAQFGLDRNPRRYTTPSSDSSEASTNADVNYEFFRSPPLAVPQQHIERLQEAFWGDEKSQKEQEERLLQKAFQDQRRLRLNLFREPDSSESSSFGAQLDRVQSATEQEGNRHVRAVANSRSVEDRNRILTPWTEEKQQALEFRRLFDDHLHWNKTIPTWVDGDDEYRLREASLMRTLGLTRNQLNNQRHQYWCALQRLRQFEWRESLSRVQGDKERRMQNMRKIADSDPAEPGAVEQDVEIAEHEKRRGGRMTPRTKINSESHMPFPSKIEKRMTKIMSASTAATQLRRSRRIARQKPL